MAIERQLLDQLLSGGEVFAKDGLPDHVKKALQISRPSLRLQLAPAAAGVPVVFFWQLQHFS
ncbi:hypothetical protein [Mesorhizobium sp. ORS 3428]|uniref:hypothetical protein n=1 Tax=Mesorhizobium sp. ORS 3428 TaxID=540997 RepID=UPI000D527D19|nr:hypothetical protein [Mesorhizobium sp. ORS 3428]